MHQGIVVAGNARLAEAWLPLWKAAGIAARAFGASSHTTAPATTDNADSLRTDMRVLFVCTDDLLECEDILFEGPAFAKTAPHLDTVVIAATLPPRFVRALRGRVATHITLIDAPWTGSMRMAQRGALSMLLGGPRTAIDDLAAVFEPLATVIERMGDFGSAMAAKVMKDFLSASSTAMTRLALDWAQAQGIEERRLLDIIGGGRALATAADQPDSLNRAVPQLSEGVMAALVKEVENAFDAALAGASLTPPTAIRHVLSQLRGRALH
jgi:3-hydroxyisobutyrate dehydrogenase-like beta-hydroxyacid dehydrogenase